MATNKVENDSTVTEETVTRKSRSVSTGARPRSYSSPWKSAASEFPKHKHKTRSSVGRPMSGSPRKSIYSSSPSDRRRKRSNSDGVTPKMPFERDGIALGSIMAQEASKSFWNSEMLENSLQKLREYAEDIMKQAEKNKTENNNKNDTSSDGDAESVDDSNVEEIYLLEEDTCTSTSEDLLGKSETGLTSDDQLGKSDTGLTGTVKSDISLNGNAPLSSSLNLQSVFTTLHSLSDHQLDLRPRRHHHMVYSSNSMRRAHTDPCLSPRLLRMRQMPVSSLLAGTLEVCR